MNYALDKPVFGRPRMKFIILICFENKIVVRISHIITWVRDRVQIKITVSLFLVSFLRGSNT